MSNMKCKICRRLGVSVCGREKCALRKKPYPPGQSRRKRGHGFSEYGKELREKQKLRMLYNLQEAQFRKYVDNILGGRSKNEDLSEQLIKTLETRLDNIIFRLGLASSRRGARQLVSHGHFLVNGKSVNIPSLRIKKGDIIRLKDRSIKKKLFQNLLPLLKKQKIPSWLSFSLENWEAKVTGEPSLQEAAPPVEIPVIFEYYSR